MDLCKNTLAPEAMACKRHFGKPDEAVLIGDYLFYASLCYLTLPSVIFFFGYLLWYWAIGAVGVLAIGLFYGVKEFRHSFQTRFSFTSSSPVMMTSGKIVPVLLIALLWMLLSGVGGYGHQDEDWKKHNAMLYDLIRSPWPVSYATSAEQLNLSLHEDLVHFPLVYYIAYYLPAAIVGKLAGWFWAQQCLFLWTYIGVCLALLWFMVLVGRSTWSILVIFVVISGLDGIGLALLRTLLHQPLLLRHWDQIELWSANWQYSANTSLLFWVPNQAVSGWISSALLLYVLRASTIRKTILLYMSLTPLWSPFITLGLVPFVLAGFFLDTTRFSKNLHEYLSIANCCGAGIFLLFGGFYLAKLSELPLPLPPVQKGLIFFVPRVPGLFWYEILALLVLFFVLEVGVYALIIFIGSKKVLNHNEWKIFLFLIMFLFLLPFFRYGYWNDLVMRVSIPALFVLWAFTAKTFYQLPRKNGVIIVLSIVFLLGSITTLVEFKRHIKGIHQKKTLFKLPKPQALYSVKYPVDPSFFLQYIGKAETPFFEYMTKPFYNSLVFDRRELSIDYESLSK